ncbi:Exonuclease RNase T and DNA polymerase III [Methanococcus vannielii SB]|uniref:Exonuclease RNase T and DNA polymerase III n=1 Tax=Methanococcus vannielii (strain ATCC 35089 / DSM 1224 / JCM 13029 / OCM 148 / SB) TaxID=406327 RepID=A6UN72_METVS|nr:3'-5' exonuclease [Methanococcus vannielii]ABR53944.1 Exonuclease RNase T and DNA polymerase III [Methanococcus vannielii SB]
MYVFLDTETTGLHPGQIAQLSYLVTDEELNIKKAFNQYYSVEHMSRSAARIHGLTQDILEELSSGLVFEDTIKEVLSDLKYSVIIGHNISFDIRFLKAEIERLGEEYVPKEKFCTMCHFTKICKIPGVRQYKRPKLIELMDYLKQCPKEGLKFTKNTYGCSDVGFHDARFDTGVMYLCYKKGVELRHIK